MNKVVIAVGGVAATAAVTVAAALPQLHGYLWPDVKAADAPAPAAPAPGVPVTGGTVEAKDMPVLLNGIGTVQAYNMVTIKTRVDGQIVKVSFTEGQEVKAGEPLIQIDPRGFQAALEVAQAAKAKDEAQLTSADADLDRYSKLVGSGFQTRQSYDQQKATVAQLQAAIKGDQAQIDAAQVNLDYTDIRAPISGRLGVRIVDVGNLVHASDNSGLVTITQTKPIYVNFTLPQENLHKIHEKQEQNQLKVQAYGSDNVTLLSEGKLAVIDNTVDQATGTIRLKATFGNADERLWPGEFVNVRLILNTRKSVPTVPQQTVQVGPNGYYAYVIKADDTVERRAVDVAAIQDGVAVINNGLQPGEKVVVDGQYRLTEGARVRLAAPAPGASG
ncbi:MAG: efflux RND transporter periplasmic adaptor subunit [Alphaproteobacteria bacterium]|nr:efflux RND transporter periplasmic adaptor subunit [Alphaproteobacteria bacterium]MBV9552544.1 efflux RND transporter periplasmic adaptor subunit [Alphaproteobacteria bacterium]